MLNILVFTFLTLSLISALGVILSRNPIHSIIYLIYTFLNASAILFCFNLEFIAILLIIVYVGAIAVLFLFVIMLLKIRLIEFNEDLKKYIPISFLVGVTLFLELHLLFSRIFTSINEDKINLINYVNILNNQTNTMTIGKELYTDYSVDLIIVSLLLLSAMIGAIYITSTSNSISKKQDIGKQIKESKKNVINYF